MPEEHDYEAVNALIGLWVSTRYKQLAPDPNPDQTRAVLVATYDILEEIRKHKDSGDPARDIQQFLEVEEMAL